MYGEGRMKNEWDEGKHWSMSLGTLMRIDKKLQQINEIKMQYDSINLPLYATVLDVLYDEVHPFLAKQEHRLQAEVLYKILTEKYHRYGVNNSGIRKVGGAELFSACNALNRFLREMLYEYDLLMNRPEDTSQEF